MEQTIMALPRWWRLLALVLGLGLAVNGLFMLADPMNWYITVPGVVDTGPPNRHFIGDIGGAYLATSLGLIGGALWPRLAAGGAMVAAIFHLVHSWVHLMDAAAGRCSPAQAVADIGPVHIPTLLILLLAITALRRKAS